MPPRKAKLDPRLRFAAPNRSTFGPGKAELLQRIQATGSIAKSAAQMKMSYNRAWLLVRETNQIFRTPLVSAVRGGSTGGGSCLTDLGREILARYHRMEKACHKAVEPEWTVMRRQLRR